MRCPFPSPPELMFVRILAETNRFVEGCCDCERSVDTLCGLIVGRARGFQRPIIEIKIRDSQPKHGKPCDFRRPPGFLSYV